MASKLKGLKDLGAFDGDKAKTDLPRDVPLPKCKHVTTLISGSELRCIKCNAGWTGENMVKLHEAFKEANNPQ